MKINKIILVGVILILFGGLQLITNIFTPFVRPITYLFLMGSSKGKDILFFALFGFFLIISQLSKKKSNKALLSIIISSTLILTLAILLEIYLRITHGISINTIFVTVRPSFSTTSILHSHLMKSVLGQLLVNTISPLIGSGINTAFSLYKFVSPFTVPIAILFIILFISECLAIQKRDRNTTVLLSFFSTILLIGCFDGGVMGTPGALGLVGCVFIYWRETHNINKMIPVLVGLFIIFLRISICIVGANPEYYEVNIYNPDDNVNLTEEYPVTSIAIDGDKITYHMDSSLNEMNLTNSLSKSLNNSCDYYTVSWNFYSYV